MEELPMGGKDIFPILWKDNIGRKDKDADPCIWALTAVGTEYQRQVLA